MFPFTIVNVELLMEEEFIVSLKVQETIMFLSTKEALSDGLVDSIVGLEDVTLSFLQEIIPTSINENITREETIFEIRIIL